jgi:hypothetical protein
VVGIYADAGGTPGALLAQTTIGTPIGGAWNAADLPGGPTIVAGATYWIAVLGPAGGTPRFRDGASGGAAQTRSQSNLTTLPATWSRGNGYPNSPMSAYFVALP